MADQKLSALTELATTPADDDEVYIRDVSEPMASESKRILISNLMALLLRLIGGTMTGPLIIGDDTYIQIGDTEGSLCLRHPGVEAEFAWFSIQPSAGNRRSSLAIMPKGTSNISQIFLVNCDDPTLSNYSCFNIEVVGNLVRLAIENIGTPPTPITRVELRNTWETQHLISAVDGLYDLGSSSQRYGEVHARSYFFIQALDGDHRWSGIVALMTAGTALTRTQAVYVNGNSKMEKALATGTATMPAIALATFTIAENAEGKFLMQGFFRDDSWNWTPGGLLYISRATAGALTQVLPAASGEQVQVVGVAITATIIHFNPSYELVEIS